MILTFHVPSLAGGNYVISIEFSSELIRKNGSPGTESGFKTDFKWNGKTLIIGSGLPNFLDICKSD